MNYIFDLNDQNNCGHKHTNITDYTLPIALKWSVIRLLAESLMCSFLSAHLKSFWFKYDTYSEPATAIVGNIILRSLSSIKNCLCCCCCKPTTHCNKQHDHVEALAKIFAFRITAMEFKITKNYFPGSADYSKADGSYCRLLLSF